MWWRIVFLCGSVLADWAEQGRMLQEALDVCRENSVGVLAASGEAEVTPIGTLSIGPTIAVTGTSVVVGSTLGEGASSRRLVLKYSTDCMPPKTINAHPVCIEFAFSRLLENLNVVPQVLYVSPPVLVGSPPLQMAQSKVVMANLEECSQSHVGLIVQARLGPTVSDCMRRAWNFDWGRILYAGAAMIGVLKKMHAQGVVHGDVHGHNVILSTEGDCPSEILDNFVFIDLGQARFFPTESGSPERATVFDPSLDLRMLSPWHILGSRVSRRDDLYRVWETMVRWTFKGRFSAALGNWIEREVAKVKEPSTPQSLPVLRTKLLVDMKLFRMHFPSALPHAGFLNKNLFPLISNLAVDQEPDYDRMIAILLKAADAQQIQPILEKRKRGSVQEAIDEEETIPLPKRPDLHRSFVHSANSAFVVFQRKHKKDT